MAIYDEDGTEVKLEDLEEFKTLSEKAGQLEGLQTSLQEKETELEKLQSKDTNFSAFRKKTKEEQDESMKDWNEREKGLMGEITDLHGRIDSRDEATLGAAKTNALKQLAGDDKDLTDKLSGQFERLGGNSALTSDEINRIYGEAAVIVNHNAGSTNKVNPINAFAPTSSNAGLAPTQKKANYADSDEGKKLAASMGLQVEEPKKG